MFLVFILGPVWLRSYRFMFQFACFGCCSGLVFSTSASDWPERIVSKMIRNVFLWTLVPTNCWLISVVYLLALTLQVISAFIPLTSLDRHEDGVWPVENISSSFVTRLGCIPMLSAFGKRLQQGKRFRFSTTFCVPLSSISVVYTTELYTKSGAESKALTPSPFVYSISSHTHSQ